MYILLCTYYIQDEINNHFSTRLRSWNRQFTTDHKGGMIDVVE